MPVTTSRFLTPEGALVTINAPGYDLGRPWSAFVTITTERPYGGVPAGLQLRELHVAATGNYDRVIERVLRGRVVDRLESQGGHIIIAHSDERDDGLVMWRGRWHEVATSLPAVWSLPRSSALRYLDGLVFTDRPLGLVIEARTPQSDSVEVTGVSKYVPGVGHLDIKPAQSAAGMVPSWSGATVRTGEVWRKESLPDEGDTAGHILLHASPTTVTLLTGEGENKGTEKPRLRFLDALTELTWIDHRTDQKGKEK